MINQDMPLLIININLSFLYIVYLYYNIKFSDLSVVRKKIISSYLRINLTRVVANLRGKKS